MMGDRRIGAAAERRQPPAEFAEPEAAYARARAAARASELGVLLESKHSHAGGIFVDVEVAISNACASVTRS